MITLYEVQPLFSLLAYVLVSILVITRNPRARANRLFTLTMVTLSFWALGEFIMRNADNRSQAFIGAGVASVGWCLVGAVFLHFAIVLAGLKTGRRIRVLLACVYALSLVLLFMSWFTSLIFEDFVISRYAGYQEVSGTLRLASKLYIAFLLLLGIAVLAYGWRRATSEHVRYALMLTLVAAVIPVATGLFTDIAVPLLNRQLPVSSQAAGVVMAFVTAYAVLSYDLMSTVDSYLGGSIIDKIREAVFITDSEGRIERINPAAEEMIGRPASNIAGGFIEDLLEPYTLGTAGDDGFFAGEASFCVDDRGARIPVTVSIQPIRRRSGRVTGSVVALHDMRDTLRMFRAEREAKLAAEQVLAERGRLESLERAQEELKKHSSFLENVIDNITEPIYIKDRDMRFVHVNRTLCELAGLRREILLGKTTDGLVPPDVAREGMDAERQVLEKGMPVETDVTDVKDARGGSHDLRILRVPLKNEHGEVEYVVGIVNDVTELKRLESARLDFIRVAAHELRTPLTSLKLGFDVLAKETRGSLDEEQKRSFDILSLSIERLSSLARNLLDLASVDAGTLTLNMQGFDIGTLIEETSAMVSNSMNEKGLCVEMDLDRELPTAYGDPGRVSQALLNLLSNSLKYTDEGTISVSAREVEGGLIEVRVSDTGCGIPRSQLRSIFTSFVKVRGPDDEKEGTGLGLSITKAIVEAHGGTIQVESKVGRGSSFYFTVPVFED
jgi:PAS domain S-box-containing protein